MTSTGALTRRNLLASEMTGSGYCEGFEPGPGKGGWSSCVEKGDQSTGGDRQEKESDWNGGKGKSVRGGN